MKRLKNGDKCKNEIKSAEHSRDELPAIVNELVASCSKGGCFDHVSAEPIPYRTALVQGATDVLVLRSRRAVDVPRTSAAMTLLAGVAGAGETTVQKAAEAAPALTAVRPEIYAPVTLAVDLSSLSASERQMLGLFIEAGEIMDDLYWRTTRRSCPVSASSRKVRSSIRTT